ncbi:MAG: phosphoglucosamine mutase [Ignavibacteria bacterium RIFCSPLOWO2_12_FULL_56_21]|nr:MAG: phosphoglucosamine mutase [Ignavibacteria bacterium RIFCSPLOWO2_12_FULL_56_21]
MSLMISISGIRGIVGSSLTPEVIIKYASSYAEYCNRGPIAIGRDGRVTGRSIAHLVASTLVQMGSDVTALGIVPTPTVALAVEKLHLAGGISVTASHNPMVWNGLKFLAPSGLFLDADENRAFWTIADRPSRSYVSWDHQGRHSAHTQFLDAHLQAILDLPYIRPSDIRARRLKVVLDCVNASGGMIVPQLLRELGCTVVEMNCDVSGIFAHTPEPVPENLGDLAQRVRDEHADLGLAVDPDADRLVVIDERGIPIGEEYTIATVVEFVLRKEWEAGRRDHTVVVNLSTTRAVDDIAKRYGATCLRTPVGEINVAKKIKEVGAVVGGEGSGGVIVPAVHTGRDAMVGAGLLLQSLAESGGTMSALKSTLPQYAITKGKVERTQGSPDGIFQRLADEYSATSRITKDDGLKIDLADAWVHLRTSNTEPIIRIIAEAPEKSRADELVKTFTQKIAK